MNSDSGLLPVDEGCEYRLEATPAPLSVGRINKGEWVYMATRPTNANTVAGRAAKEARQQTQGPAPPLPPPPPPPPPPPSGGCQHDRGVPSACHQCLALLPQWAGNDRCPVCDSSACETGCSHSWHKPCQRCQQQQMGPASLPLPPSLPLTLAPTWSSLEQELTPAAPSA